MESRPRRKSRLVLWISILAIMAAIVATALLANDKRNLREIIQRYGINWIKLAPPEQPDFILLAKRGRRLKPTAIRIPVRLPPHLFLDTGTHPATFVRRWGTPGEQLCSALAAAGIDVGPWKQGRLYSSTYECSAQISGTSDGSSDAASLFLLVRGTPAGAVSSVRMKVILPDTEEGRRIAEKFTKATEILFQQSRWEDFSDSLPAITRLENVNQTAFGARLTFAHEFSDPRRFNLILDLYPTGADQKTTALYFDRSKWLQMTEKTTN